MDMTMQYPNNLMTEMKINSAIRDRRVFINGVIEDDLSFEVCYFLNRIYEIDKKNNISNKEITLVINSYGGSTIAGNAIIGMLEFLKNKNYCINALVQGFAFSMAFDILVCCTHRSAYRLAQFMVHQSQVGKSGYDDLIEYERDIDFSKREWEQSIDYYVKYTKISREKIQEIYNCRKNYFMLANEALELGVIDKII
jgi:ATP-dependent protease ClpP protease subunit